MTDITLYKPKQVILSLTDDELTLWYGKKEAQLIRLIGDCNVTTTKYIYNENLIYYIKNSKSLMSYNIETKYINLIDKYILKSDDLTLKTLKEIFNYDIAGFVTLTNYKSKYNNRFIVEFPIDFGIESWFIGSIDKPKFVNYTWQNMDIELIDIIGPSTGQPIYNFIEFLKKQKDEDVKILFEIKIHSLDPTGVIVDEWVIQAESVAIDFGKFDYSNIGQSKIIMTIKPFNCIFNY